MTIKNIPYNKIYYADSINGDDDKGDGSELKPFKTLSKALSLCENKDAIFLKNVHAGNSMSFKDKDIFLIGDYFKFNSIIEGQITNLTGSIYNIYFKNLTTSAWGETFAYCNVKLYNCIFHETSANSNVYGDYEFYNCVIIEQQDIFTKTKFFNCAFKNESLGNFEVFNCLKECIFDESFKILNNKWLNTGTGINKDGNTANIGIYGGEFDFINKFFIIYTKGKYYSIKSNEIIQLQNFENTSKYFIQHGFNYFNLKKIRERFKDLDDLKVLMWTDTESAQLNYLIKPFRPIDKFSGKIELIRQTEK